MNESFDLVPIIIAFFVAAASPGPATLASATVSMSAGRKPGVIFGLGLSLGLAFWGIVAATGLGAILQTSAEALFILKIAGGLYLLWLAFSSARSAMHADATKPRISNYRNYLNRGLLLNLSNPKAVFAWMAVLALGLGEGSSTVHLWLATASCIATGFIIYTTYALMFSMTGVMDLYQRIQSWITGLAAALFALAGFSLLRSAFSR